MSKIDTSVPPAPPAPSASPGNAAPLLEGTAPTVEPLTAPAMEPAPPPPTPLAPPEPAPPVPERDERLAKMLALIALVSLGIAMIMTVLWLSNRGGEEGTADAPATEATDAGTVPLLDQDGQAELQFRLDEAEAQAEALQQQVALLEAGRTAGDQAETNLAEAQAQLTATETELAERQSSLDDAISANADLEAQLAAATAEIDALTAESGSDVDLTDAPEFARWIGELLSSRSGGSRLGADASTCFGAAIVDQIGLDALGAGQNNAATGAARQAVIDAMVAAADTCGINQSLIFG